MDLIVYQVLLPNTFWGLAKSKDELKRMIEQYLSVRYPQYEIQKIIKSGQAHLAICIRR
ncbi:MULTISPECIES: hypothetical protein [Bacillus]|uniref:hypothetical protein n=1 Tax=Bacillus TaxID=1386 RepID=UPI00027996A9|nr:MULTISPECIES: hypothetical protein [Bacillus]EJS13443.1 hypothetical protein IKS_03522 [Bacillus cereus VDM062]WJE66482.1 hypothetical protein QRE63_11520 [Bacillus mycoides]